MNSEEYQYKFLGNSSQVDEIIQQNISTLNDIDIKQSSFIFKSVLANAAQKLSTNSIEDIVNHVCSDIYDNLNLRSKSLKRVLHSLFSFITGAIKYNLSSTSVESDLLSIGLDSAHAKLFTKLWSKAYVSLNRSAVQKSLKFNEVVDMQWKFGVIASSDSAAKDGTTYLQLQLVLNKGGKLENVAMELSLKQFYQFLREMEKAKLMMENVE